MNSDLHELNSLIEADVDSFARFREESIYGLEASRVGTRGGKISVRGEFSGWSIDSIMLDKLMEFKGKGDPSFIKTGPKLYRITVRNKRPPIYIGMTRGRVRDRINDHLRGHLTRTGRSRKYPKGSKSLRDFIRQHGVNLNAYRIRIGYINDESGFVSQKLLHIYELYLQLKEMNTKFNKQHKLFNPRIFTFDDFEDMRSI